MLNGKMIVFRNLDTAGEIANDGHVEKIELQGPGTIKGINIKGRSLSAYGAPYRVRLYRSDPRQTLALYFAEYAPASLQDDERTPDVLSSTVSLIVPRVFFATYQLLNVNAPGQTAFIQVGLQLDITKES